MTTCYFEGEAYECSWSEKYIFPIYDGLDRTSLADFIKESANIVPWAGVFHLFALALIGGAILLVDLRVFGIGLRSKSAAEVMISLHRMTIIAVALAVVSGVVLALGELMKLYYSPPYWLKMFSFVTALIFTFGVRNDVIRNNGVLGSTRWAIAFGSVGAWLLAFVILSNSLARAALLLLVGALFAIDWLGRRITPPTEQTALRVKLISAMSITMWLTTAAAGRWIAFY